MTIIRKGDLPAYPEYQASQRNQPGSTISQKSKHSDLERTLLDDNALVWQQIEQGNAASKLDLSFEQGIEEEPYEHIGNDPHAQPYYSHFTEAHGSSLEFFSRTISEEKSYLSIQIRADGSPKFGSDYLKQKGRDLGKTLINYPLRNAWNSNDFTSPESLKAMGWATGVLSVAILSPVDIKSNLKVVDTELAGYQIDVKTGLHSGEGELDLETLKLSFQPGSEQDRLLWQAEIQHHFEDEQTRFSWSKPLSFGSVSKKTKGNFRFDLFHGKQERPNEYGGIEKQNEYSAKVRFHRSFYL